MDEMRDLKLLKQTDKELALTRFKELSRYPKSNALTKKYMPLSDVHHGPYCMMPPELLHTGHVWPSGWVVRKVAHGPGFEPSAKDGVSSKRA